MEYRYVVDGQNLVGHRLAIPGCSCGPQAYAESTASRYAVGSTVADYYAPENPATSTMKVNDTASGMWFIVLLLGMAILHIAIAWKHVRNGHAVHRMQRQGMHV